MSHLLFGKLHTAQEQLKIYQRWKPWYQALLIFSWLAEGCGQLKYQLLNHLHLILCQITVVFFLFSLVITALIAKVLVGLFPLSSKHTRCHASHPCGKRGIATACLKVFPQENCTTSLYLLGLNYLYFCCQLLYEKKASSTDPQAWFLLFHFSYDYFTPMLPTATIHYHCAQAYSQALRSYFTLNHTHLLITTSNINMEQKKKTNFSVQPLGTV